MRIVVISTRTGSQLMIVARPNQSATWRENLWLILLLSIPVFIIAIGFALLGAWLVLPFAGLEILALTAALYRVQWKLQYRHVITVSDDTVCIDKGYDQPQEHWRFAKESAGMTITRESHPADSPSVCVHDRSDSVGLGEFLNREDGLKLIDLLQQEIRVRSDGMGTQRPF